MNYNFLIKTSLFRGTSEEELDSMLQCLGTITKTFKKNDMIYQIGDTIDSMGLVLSGSVNIESDDIWGNKSILDHVDSGQFFAETYACIPEEPLMINVVAAEKTTILFLNTLHLLKTCSNACNHHSKLIQNLLSISAQKNLNLSRRIFHTSPKSIRGRLLSYLSYHAVHGGSYEFSIPFNRQQLADYLGVDRSAMSNELSKMQKEGLITFKKNQFCLYEEIERNL